MQTDHSQIINSFNYPTNLFESTHDVSYEDHTGKYDCIWTSINISAGQHIIKDIHHFSQIAAAITKDGIGKVLTECV
jgi:hypothetical protein